MMAARRKTRKSHKLKRGTVVLVKAPFEHSAWIGKIVGEQGPPYHEVFRFLVEPSHGVALLWRRPSEMKAAE